MMNYKQILGLLSFSVLILYVTIPSKYYPNNSPIDHITSTSTFISKDPIIVNGEEKTRYDDNNIKKGILGNNNWKEQTKILEITSTRFILSTLQKTPRSTTLQPVVQTTKNPIRNLSWPIKPNAPCKRVVKGRGSEEGRWYDYSREDFVLYTYSSLVDDRDTLESGPVLRIIAISTDVTNMANRPSLYCRFYFPISLQSMQGTNKERRRDLVMNVKVESKPDRYVGMGWSLNSKLAREFIYTCPLPEKKMVLEKLRSTETNYTKAFEVLETNYTVKRDYLMPSWASLLVGEEKGGYKYDDVTSCMPVEASPKLEKTKKFALCVQVAYGAIDPKQLVIWLELQKLLGVDNIGIYDMNIDKPAMEVLKFYAEQGLVDLRRSDYIPHGHKQYLLHGSPVINDCMYRHLHTHDYMLVYDIDEVILPVKNQSTGTLKNFYDLLTELLSKYGSGDYSYTFRNRYFFFDHQQDTKEPTGFDILKYKMAAPVSNFGYATKSMLNMKACIQMHNHFCWGATKTYEGQRTVDVSTKLATNQHYKKCHLGEECDKMIKNSVYYDAINAYKSDLIKNVYKAIDEIRPRMKSLGLSDPFEELKKI